MKLNVVRGFFFRHWNSVTLVALWLCLGNAYADPVDLQQQRISAIKQYVRLVGRGDYQSIPNLFTKTAVIVSAAGEPDSINHYIQATKRLTKSQSHLINIFDGQLKNNMMTAYYNLSWTNTDGGSTSARLVELFIFQADSTKIKTVYVFSNQFHDDAAS